MLGDERLSASSGDEVQQCSRSEALRVHVAGREHAHERWHATRRHDGLLVLICTRQVAQCCSGMDLRRAHVEVGRRWRLVVRRVAALLALDDLALEELEVLAEDLDGEAVEVNRLAACLVHAVRLLLDLLVL